MGIKAAKKFNKDVESYLTSIGAVKSEDQLGYPWEVETSCGKLRISIPEAESHGKVYTIFTRFEDTKRAVNVLRDKGMNPCNPFTGKWNFHEFEPHVCINSFMWDLGRIRIDTIG